MKVCRRLGIPVQVVSHDGNVIQISSDFLQVKILVVLLFCRQGGSEQISASQFIQSAPEFCRQSSEVCLVLRTSLMNAAFHRILPINIDSVKNTISFNTVGEVAGNKGLRAGTNEIALMIRRSRA